MEQEATTLESATSDMMIGYRLKETQAVLRSRMDEALRPMGLSTPQYACLELLSRAPGASNSDLARGAFVTRQAMNTLLRGLQERGLVDRAAEAVSGRVLPTTLTPAGTELLGKAARAVHAIERQMVAVLTPGQRDSLQQALASCIEALRG